ncbi:MAG: MiaB/RimO family radical SAM methylthiotransferase [Candidatus Gracilibacteria bacterium]
MLYFLHTFGCQMNASDSERLTAVLEGLGYKPAIDENKADLILFNTCSIRKKAEDRVYSKLSDLKALKKKNPKLLIGVTGCMTRSSGIRNSKAKPRDPLFRIKMIDFVFRIDDLARLGELLKEAQPSLKLKLEKGVEAAKKDYFTIAPKRVSAAQAWIPIQTGCDKFCTYCIVPFSRRREHSRPMDEVLVECKEAVKKGATEIVLLGQTVDSYGLSVADKLSGHFPQHTGIPNVVFNSQIFGKGKNAMASSRAVKKLEKTERPFLTLLREIDKLHKNGLRRLRFLSPHPHDFCEELVRLHKELKTLQPYFHLPVQAGSDAVLKAMRRTYTASHYLNLIDMIRKYLPDAAISTDIIVGFPGETEADFKKTCTLAKKVKWDMVYLAMFSPRKGTYAEKHLKDDVLFEEKKRRFAVLNEILKKGMAARNKPYLGQVVEVLVEKQKGDRYSGRTPHFKEVFFTKKSVKNCKSLIGSYVRVKITKIESFYLEGAKVGNLKILW